MLPASFNETRHTSTPVHVHIKTPLTILKRRRLLIELNGTKFIRILKIAFKICIHVYFYQLTYEGAQLMLKG